MGQLKDKIQNALDEGRMLVLGAQALLGFQLITMFTDAFEKLPVASKYVHLSSLSLVGVSIVEEGEETEHFHRFASRVLIAAMIPLALGIFCS